MLTTLPSGLWRTAMAVGIPVGVSDQIRHERYGFPGWGTVYLFGLTLLLVGLALLTLGLVHRWGEVVPRWIPLVGATRVPPLAAVVPAGSGAGALTLLWLSAMSNVEEIWAVYGLDGAERALMMACYAPLLLWGPLLAALTVSYHRRHRPTVADPALSAMAGSGPDSVRLRLFEEAVRDGDALRQAARPAAGDSWDLRQRRERGGPALTIGLQLRPRAHAQFGTAPR